MKKFSSEATIRLNKNEMRYPLPDEITSFCRKFVGKLGPKKTSLTTPRLLHLLTTYRDEQKILRPLEKALKIDAEKIFVSNKSELLFENLFHGAHAVFLPKQWLSSSTLNQQFTNTLLSFYYDKIEDYTSLEDLQKKISGGAGKNLIVISREDAEKILISSSHSFSDYPQGSFLVDGLSDTNLIDVVKILSSKPNLGIIFSIPFDPKNSQGLYVIAGWTRAKRESFELMDSYLGSIDPFKEELTRYILEESNSRPYPLEDIISPEVSSHSLSELIAKFHHNIPSSYIHFGNGSEELLRRIIMKRSIVALSDPHWHLYEEICQAHNVERISYPIKPFAEKYDIHPIIEILGTKKEVDLVVLCSPNNPTGTVIDKESLEELLRWAQENSPKTMFLIDEVYSSFFTNHKTLLTKLGDFDNVAILKSFSKSFGLPGLRLGYLLCTPQFAENLGFPCQMKDFFVDDLKKQVTRMAISNYGSHKKYVNQIIKDRDELIKYLSKTSSVKVWPSQANFVLCELAYEHATLLIQDLLAKHVLVREENDLDYLITSERTYIRISIGTSEEMKLVKAAFSNLFCVDFKNPDLIFLDIEGTLDDPNEDLITKNVSQLQDLVAKFRGTRTSIALCTGVDLRSLKSTLRTLGLFKRSCVVRWHIAETGCMVLKVFAGGWLNWKVETEEIDLVKKHRIKSETMSKQTSCTGLLSRDILEKIDRVKREIEESASLMDLVKEKERGMVHSLSYKFGRFTVDFLKEELQALIKDLKYEDHFDLCFSQSAVDIIPKPLSKGFAVTELASAEYYNIPLKNIAYIGDASNDISALKIVGFPIAVNNATMDVKELVKKLGGKVLSKSFSDGVIEYLTEVVERL